MKTRGGPFLVTDSQLVQARRDGGSFLRRSFPNSDASLEWTSHGPMVLRHSQLVGPPSPRQSSIACLQEGDCIQDERVVDFSLLQ